jgi:hypothetical protein
MSLSLYASYCTRSPVLHTFLFEKYRLPALLLAGSPYLLSTKSHTTSHAYVTTGLVLTYSPTCTTPRTVPVHPPCRTRTSYQAMYVGNSLNTMQHLAASPPSAPCTIPVYTTPRGHGAREIRDAAPYAAMFAADLSTPAPGADSGN